MYYRLYARDTGKFIARAWINGRAGWNGNLIYIPDGKK